MLRLFIYSWLVFFSTIVPCVGELIPPGTGSFTFIDPEGNPNRPIRVFYHRPKNVRTDSSILFVIHGVSRNAEGYRNTWIRYADQKNLLLLCPEFSREHYPNSRHYNLGYMYTSKGKLRNRKRWSFYAVERIFDQVVEQNALEAEQYSIYGHSGGGQFVHRMVLFMPEARIKLAIAENPGWYTMPTQNIMYPYGLGNTKVDEVQIRQAFGRRFFLLLGTADTDPKHEHLRKTPEAMAQGPHRLARGKEFVRQSRTLAKQLKMQIKWRMKTVPNAAHSNSKMSAAAAKLIR